MSQVKDAFQLWLLSQNVFCGCNLITEVCSDLVHWIFAFKYWTVACRLEEIQSGANPDRYNLQYTAIFIAGLILNLAAGVLTSLGYPEISAEARRKLEIATSVFTLPLILSCIFLGDAFRRFRKTKQETQTINNKQIGVLSIAFGSFALGILALEISYKLKNFKETLWMYELTIVSFFASTVLLSTVLYKLIVDQAANTDYITEVNEAELNYEHRYSVNSLLSEELDNPIKDTKSRLTLSHLDKAILNTIYEEETM